VQWKARYGADYTWNRKADPAQIKRLLKTLTPGDLEARMVVYLTSADPFYEKNQHPFGLFVSQINAFTPKTHRPVGCRHDPVCASEVLHTQRIVKESRQGVQ
jgi:hypothetical protein